MRIATDEVLVPVGLTGCVAQREQLVFGGHASNRLYEIRHHMAGEQLDRVQRLVTRDVAKREAAQQVVQAGVVDGVLQEIALTLSGVPATARP